MARYRLFSSGRSVRGASATGRRTCPLCRLPLRFTTDKLQVFPSTKRNGDGKATDERLDTQKVLAASIDVYKHIDATR